MGDSFEVNSAGLVRALAAAGLLWVGGAGPSAAGLPAGAMPRSAVPSQSVPIQAGPNSSDTPDKTPDPKSAPRVKPKPGEPRSVEPKSVEPRSGDQGGLPKTRREAQPKPRPGQPGFGGRAASQKPGLAVQQPRTAAERDKALSDLYALLATAENAEQAKVISASIEQLWETSGSDTIALLMQRATAALEHKNTALALKLLDAVVDLAPDYAEGWNRRAYIHVQRNEIDLAMGDWRRTLALDPNNFRALEGLVHTLQELDHKKEALQFARKLLDVDPFAEGARQAVDELSRDVEDRGI